MAPPSIVRSALSVFFEYDTPRIVHIRSKKVGIINRFLQLAIISYVIGFAIIYKKGYQDFDDVNSAVTTKLKGVALTNLTDEGINGTRVWDVADYVIPPQENNAFFVMTNVIVTPGQQQTTCLESPSVPDGLCSTKKPCEPDTPVVNGNGVKTGNCKQLPTNSSVEVCEIYAWCPVEKDDKPSKPVLLASQNFTVFIKNNIEFGKFGVKRRNLLEDATDAYLRTCNYNSENKSCPIFQLKTIVEMAGQDYEIMALQGGVIQILIQWNCNLDLSVEDCVPEYQFRRLDSNDYTLAKGFNFRYAEPYFEDGVKKRTLIKAYGIRFIVTVEGKAGKFNFVPLFLNIGSGLALLSIATIVCDIVVLYFLKARKFFKEKKYLDVKGADAYETLDEGSMKSDSPVVQRKP
ncbi:P2X purinoceptor 4 isoform X2 [Patella vulgata]|uniref:P2X purinoceptor 4 isoform X2 n=1 Tax=Patella vulgata TaxID=6465 RepID=UPI0024A7E079|nr:P2X purinoceptor 4 isoform X2 [Patella vulgata]